MSGCYSPNTGDSVEFLYTNDTLVFYDQRPSLQVDCSVDRE